MPTEKERLRQIYERLQEIMDMDDETCDRIEAEFKKNNIFK